MAPRKRAEGYDNILIGGVMLDQDLRTGAYVRPLLRYSGLVDPPLRVPLSRKGEAGAQ
jgi:hypothetical protein